MRQKATWVVTEASLVFNHIRIDSQLLAAHNCNCRTLKVNWHCDVTLRAWIQHHYYRMIMLSRASRSKGCAYSNASEGLRIHLKAGSGATAIR